MSDDELLALEAKAHYELLDTLRGCYDLCDDDAAYVEAAVVAVPALIARLRSAEERIERLRDRIEGEYRACSCKDDVGALISDICAASSHHVDCVICEERLVILRADAALASRPHDPK